MVEIQLTASDSAAPQIIRNPGQRVKVVVPINLDSDEVLAYLATKLSAEELNSFINLWSEDNHPRVFDKQKDYLAIRDQE